jgi:hypothetical protein
VKRSGWSLPNKYKGVNNGWYQLVKISRIFWKIGK